MKNQIQLSVNTPCSEQWQNFAPTSSGGFCVSCNKDVIDFTKMTDSEVITFLQDKPAHACGRFRTDQLKAYAMPSARSFSIRPSRALLRIGLLSMLFALGDNFAFAQRRESVQKEIASEQLQQRRSDERIVRGTVTSGEDGALMPGVSVLLAGTAIGTATDADGKFEFPKRLKAGDQLVFSFIGFETMQYLVPEKDAPIEITMQVDAFVLMGAIATDEVFVPKKEHRGLVAVVKDWFR